MAAAASRTTNPLLIALVLAVVGFVVVARRSDAPWARGFAVYLAVALAVVAIRVVFRMLLSSQYGGYILFRLPEIPLPKAAAGIRLGGPVSAQGVLAALYDGARLGALLVCLGAANVLSDPKRLLKSIPGALHELGTSITVALSAAPQLIESGQRVQRARRLRGGSSRRRRILRQVFVPVLADALDRSISLAAAMESRGFGRASEAPSRSRRVTGAVALAGLVGVCGGTYGLLDATTPRWMGLPMLLAGLALALAGVVAGGRRVRRSVYRPSPWRWEEWAVAASGIACAVLLFFGPGIDPSQLNPSLQPLRWPPLPLGPVAAILVGLLPVWIAPPATERPGIRPTPPQTKSPDSRALRPRRQALLPERVS
jgi:energy-coupling factor transport system permease protein